MTLVAFRGYTYEMSSDASRSTLLRKIPGLERAIKKRFPKL